MPSYLLWTYIRTSPIMVEGSLSHIVAQTPREARGMSTASIVSQYRPLFSGRFVAKSQSRVARPTRGVARDRGVLKKYVEGLSNEPVGLATQFVAWCVAPALARSSTIQSILVRE